MDLLLVLADDVGEVEGTDDTLVASRRHQHDNVKRKAARLLRAMLDHTAN